MRRYEHRPLVKVKGCGKRRGWFPFWDARQLRTFHKAANKGHFSVLTVPRTKAYPKYKTAGKLPPVFSTTSRSVCAKFATFSFHTLRRKLPIYTPPTMNNTFNPSLMLNDEQEQEFLKLIQGSANGYSNLFCLPQPAAPEEYFVMPGLSIPLSPTTALRHAQNDPWISGYPPTDQQSKGDMSTVPMNDLSSFQNHRPTAPPLSL